MNASFRVAIVFNAVSASHLGLLLGTCVLVYLQSMPVIGWMVVG